MPSVELPPAAPLPPVRPHFVRQVLRLAGPYWNAGHRLRVRSATLVLFLLTLAQVGLTVWSSYWHRDLFDALEQRATGQVLVQVGVFALIFALTIAVTAAHLMVKRWLQLDWRQWLTRRLVDRWMDSGRHYRLQFREGEHDNPDGRIAEDIRIATESAISLGHTLVYSLLSAILFVDILWQASGQVQIPGTAVAVPGYMVPLAFLYAGIGAVLGWSFGRPLVRATNALQTAEADFRFGLARAREHSEPIAVMRGEPMERDRAARRFAIIVRDWTRQSVAYMGIVGFSTGYSALLPVFPILVASPQFIMGAISLGVLIQIGQSFQQLTSALSWPTHNLGEIALARASADRVLALHEDIGLMDEDARQPDGHRIVVEQGQQHQLIIRDLAIADPAGVVLIENLSCRIMRGERVLVAGDPAVTSAFFKVIAGLWPWGHGHVQLPDHAPVSFMLQRPFLPEGTLRAALCYPKPVTAYSTESLGHALECAGVAWLGPRLDEADNWEHALPLRAQQRLGFARVMLEQPAWVFMEEATDAFDPRSEKLILEMLLRELPNSGIVTISFHSGLDDLYDRKVILSRLPEIRRLGERRPQSPALVH